MAGSLRHITAPDGRLRMDLVEDGGDKVEAIEECFDVIAALLEAMPSWTRSDAFSQACAIAKVVMPPALPRRGERTYRRLPPPSYDFMRRP